MRMDILSGIQSAVHDSLKNGATLAQFKKELKPLLQDKGW